MAKIRAAWVGKNPFRLKLSNPKSYFNPDYALEKITKFEFKILMRNLV